VPGRIGATGLEPVTKKSQPNTNKELTEKSKTATAQKLPKSCNSCLLDIVQNDTDLQQIITAWPELTEQDRKAILDIVKG
jgi:hypothetical protein